MTSISTGPAPGGARRTVGAALWICAVLLVSASVLLQLLQQDVSPDRVAQPVLLLAYPTVGLLILRRHASHAIGWVLLLSGIGLLVEDATIAYATYGLVHAPGSLPAPDVVAVVGDAFWIPGIMLAFVFTFLLAPDGRLPSPRWRPLAWVAGTTLALSLPITVLAADELYAVEGVPNPLGVDALGPVLAVLQGASIVVTFASAVLAVTAFVLRYRRAVGIERLQLRPLVAAGAAVVLMVLLLPLGLGLLSDGGVGERLATLAYDVALVLPAVGVGVGALRYRLYDVDRLINRTIAWSLLSVVLAGTYAVVVLGAQAVLGPADAPDVVVAGATLLVAALFRPVRSRVQELVDRRFDRGRYDARALVVAFSTRRRDTMDLEGLTVDLRATVAEALHPRTTLVWTPNVSGSER